MFGFGKKENKSEDTFLVTGNKVNLFSGTEQPTEVFEVGATDEMQAIIKVKDKLSKEYPLSDFDLEAINPNDAEFDLRPMPSDDS